MSNAVFRAGPQPAEVINRQRLLGFSFNGRQMSALAGDTIVSALMSNGVRAYAQGRRLQHRRGVLTADRFDPSCVLQVDDEPNVPAAHRLASSRQQVRSQHVWPSLRFDLKSMNQRVGRLLRPAAELRPTTATGFLRPAYRWLAARADVGGRLTASGQGDFRARNEHPDVLVVGAGLAGLAAAEAAARAGARTLVVEADHRPGGWLRLSADPTVTEMVTRLRALEGLEIRTDSVVAHIDRDGVALVATELAGGGEELSVVAAGHVVLATGLVERTLTFTGNDLPGVMLATGARRLADLWAVRPGQRAVVLSANSHGDAAAADLDRVGIEVVQVVDARKGGGIRCGEGSSELEQVTLASGSVLSADLLVVAPGWTVDSGLVEAAGGRVVHDRRAGRPLAVGRPGAVAVVGALAGEAELDEVVAHASVIGRQAAAAALRRPRSGAVRRAASTGAQRGAAAVGGAFATGMQRAAPPQPPLGGPLHDAAVAAVSVGVVDFAEDVTAFELFDPDPVVAARLLGRAAAAPACGPRARAELADLARRQPQVADLADELSAGRPATTSHLTGGLRLGSLARLVHHPIRRTALADEHLRLGGRMELVDDWVDVSHYGDVDAERRAVADAAGVRDSGRCGLFDLEGTDGATLLSALLADAELPSVGGVRRYPAQADRPTVVVARLADRHWQVRAEARDARTVEGRLLTLVHLEHRDWQVFLTPVGESPAGIALVGPSAPAVVPATGHDDDADRDGYGTVQALEEQLGVPGWIWRWSGPRGPVVELRAPAGRIVPLWRDVLGRAAAHGGIAVGSEVAEGAL